MKIATRVGPIMVRTRRTPQADEIITQAEPKFVTTTGPTGAKSGDHTQTSVGG